MQVSDELRAAVLRALFAVFGNRPFSVGMLLKRISGGALERPENVALCDAVVRLCQHRAPPQQRIGRRLRDHVVGHFVDGRQLLADYNARRCSWSYRVDLTREEHAASLEAFETRMLDLREKEVEELDAKLTGKSLSRQIDIIGSALDKQERFEKRMAREDEREAARVAGVEYRAEKRALDAAHSGYRAVAEPLGAVRPPGFFQSGLPIGPTIVDEEIRRYREETERLKSAASYRRICAQLAKSGRAETPENVRVVVDIEQLRGGRHWLAGMSFDPADHFDYSSRGAYRAMSAALEGPGLGAPIVLRRDWEIF